MKMNKIIAGIMAVCVMGIACPSVTGISDNTAITAKADLKYNYGCLEYINYGDYIEISGCDDYVTDVVIPAEIEGVPVTSIGGDAFNGCKSLTSITIPESVTSVGCYAFLGTPWLEEKQKENPLVIVNNILIDGTTCEGDVIIPEGVTSIGEYAFPNCTSLTSINIPESVTSIGWGAFCKCTSLISITIPDNVTSIGKFAFFDCTSLTLIDIPESVTSVEYSSFFGTPWLEEKQKENQFVIVNNILIDGKNCEGDIVIPESVMSIGDSAFSGCKGLISINIPDTVTSIGDSAFYKCTGLTSITIPESVISIEKWTFSGCKNLTSVTIPESVTSIGEHAFTDCKSLTSIEILNPDCDIDDSKYTISKTATIYGYENSTAQAYAEKYGYNFEIIGSMPIVSGDTDGDGTVSISDAVILQKYLLGTGELTNWKNADLCNDGVIDIFDMVQMRKLIIEK